MDFIPKKHFGQNFLIDKNILSKIVEPADLSFDDIVIEIGAGKGVLTEALANNGCEKVIALEIDEELIPELKTKFEDYENVEIVHQDFLKLDLPEFIKNKVGKKSYKVVANLPYYISTRIIQDFLSLEFPPDLLVVMLQKEVGEKMLVKSPDATYFSTFINFYADIELSKKVSKNCFFPKPKVDSVVVKITLHKKQFLPYFKHEQFFRLVKAGFSNKRKKLIKAIKQMSNKTNEQIEEIFNKLDLDYNIRAQELSVEKWVDLFSLLEKSF